MLQRKLQDQQAWHRVRFDAHEEEVYNHRYWHSLSNTRLLNKEFLPGGWLTQWRPGRPHSSCTWCPLTSRRRHWWLWRGVVGRQCLTCDPPGLCIWETKKNVNTKEKLERKKKERRKWTVWGDVFPESIKEQQTPLVTREDFLTYCCSQRSLWENPELSCNISASTVRLNSHFHILLIHLTNRNKEMREKSQDEKTTDLKEQCLS